VASRIVKAAIQVSFPQHAQAVAAYKESYPHLHLTGPYLYGTALVEVRFFTMLSFSSANAYCVATVTTNKTGPPPAPPGVPCDK
jgi:hypothetical protein